ncbi:MAG: hydrolase [Clostridia bacterium]|nr:hydrolase [Clostridia bacterium]
MLREDGILVCIDYQEKLMPAMAHQDELIENTAKLIQGIKALDMPIVVTTQYAKGLGETVPKIKEALGEFNAIDKHTFSCVRNEQFMETLESYDRGSVIITGAEAHICVMQTAIDLVREGFEVYVVVDCIDSRKDLDKEISLRRMEEEGVLLATTESVLYEALLGAKEPGFKEISGIVK